MTLFVLIFSYIYFDAQQSQLPSMWERFSEMVGITDLQSSRGVCNAQKSVRDFEILRFLTGFRDFFEDSKISYEISRFQWDFNEISGFQVGFQDFDCDFWISNCVVDTAKFNRCLRCMPGKPCPTIN